MSEIAGIKDKFRLLILGGGAIVTECHLPALRVLGWLDGCTVVEPFERNANEVQRLFPEVKVMESGYEDALDGDVARRFDAVLVALPNSLHFEACLRALGCGLHVLCEKPLAMNARECIELGKAAAAANRALAVGMVRRFLPSLTALRLALAAGMVGEIERVELEDGGKFLWPSDTETVFRKDQGGVLLGMGVHFLDCLEWLFGELRPVRYSDDSRGGVEVNCALDLETAKGLPVLLRISWTHAIGNSLRVIGSRGILEMRKSDVTSCRWLSLNGGLSAEVMPANTFTSGDWQPTFEACFVEQLWTFARAVRGEVEAVANLVTPAQASHAQELIEWAYAKREDAMPVLRQEDRRPRLAPAEVVVTGGTGFVGGYLIERLTELGMKKITVPVRSFRSAANAARYPVQLKRYDLLDVESCRAVVRGARHVFHLAYGTGGADSAKITVEGTRNMLEAARLEGVESVVVFGTCSVWGAVNGAVNEETPLSPSMADYGSSKAEMHRNTLAFAREHASPRVSIIAPGSVYGPQGGLFSATACQMAKDGTFAWFDGGKGTCNYVHVRNLVDMAILAARIPEAHGHAFIAVDGQATWREFFRPFVRPWLDRVHEVDFASLNKGGKVRRTGTLKELFKGAMMSPAFMSALSQHRWLGPLKDQFTRWTPKLHRRVQAMRPAPDLIRRPQAPASAPAMWLAEIMGPTGPQLVSSKARQMLGWNPIVTLTDGQAECVTWLREVVRLLPTNLD